MSYSLALDVGRGTRGALEKPGSSVIPGSPATDGEASVTLNIILLVRTRVGN